VKKTVLSLFLALLLLLPMTANAAQHVCTQTPCLVCQVADLINGLPEANEITLENAASVIDRIHAIDRLKVALTDEQYDELLTKVVQGNDGSGYGTGVPLRYSAAVNQVLSLTGCDLYIQKDFLANGAAVDITNAQVQFKLTNMSTGSVQTLTLSTLSMSPGTLAASGSHYAESSDGWTYKYILAPGTYRIEEIGDSGATVNGKAFVTGSTTYSANGQASSQPLTLTLEAGKDYSVSILNGLQKTDLSVSFKDQNGNPISGAVLTMSNQHPLYPVQVLTFDDNISTYSQVEGGPFLLALTQVPAGYSSPFTGLTFDPFLSVNGSHFNGADIAAQGVSLSGDMDSGFTLTFSFTENSAGGPGTPQPGPGANQPGPTALTEVPDTGDHDLPLLCGALALLSLLGLGLVKKLQKSL